MLNIKTTQIVVLILMVSTALAMPQESFSADDAHGLQKYISWSEKLDLGRIAEHFKDLPVSKDTSPQDPPAEEKQEESVSKRKNYLLTFISK